MSNKRQLAYILIPFLFITLLTTGRILWQKQFKPTEQPTIESGILDLRDWDFSQSPTFTLDGEWQFSPYILDTTFENIREHNSNTISIPGNWANALNPQSDSPFGYGTYHLRILSNPQDDHAFAARVSSIRGSSAVYANGKFIGKAGKVGTDDNIANDFNVPYTTSTIWANEDGIIDLFIQVTNRTDPRSAGIIRSMKFGEETALFNEIEQSTFLQLSAAVFYFVFVIFAVILYVVGWKDRRLLYFALVICMIMFVTLGGGDDKLLAKNLRLSYDVGYKLSFSFFVLTGIALVQCVRPKIISKINYLLIAHAMIGFIAIVTVLILPVKQLTYASLFSVSYLIFSMAFAGFLLFMNRKQFSGGILLSLASLALAHHFIWYGYSLYSGVKTMYYPFDLMIGLILLAATWFKNYYKTYQNTRLYAQKLKLADEIRDEFLANTSHELRNPLNGILNISEAVLKRETTALQPESKRDLETVQEVGKRMIIMLNDLLDFTRLRNQQPKLTFVTTSLPQNVLHSIDIIRFMTNGNNIQFVNKVPDDFPLLQADEQKLQQILFNLLHNAVKYTEEGTITISASAKNGFSHIYIHDTGQGMTTDTSQQIFSPYYQEQTNQGGFGIGLSLTKKLVELHGGTISVTSTLHEETTFRFTIPLAEEQILQPIAATTEVEQKQNEVFTSSLLESESDNSALPERSAMGEKKRILVVDDDPVNLQVITSILDDYRFDITTVLNPTEALTLLSKSTWDLLITDVMMPGMTGYELTEKMRIRYSLTELPIILLTARAQETEIEYGFSIGANDYVTKPVSAVELTSRIHTLLDMKTSAEERLLMESAWLQAQIQPHFLFNTLNTILALSELDIERMQKLLEAFNHLLRQKFQFQRSDELWSIQEEIDFVKSYVYIEQERFGDRIVINWDLDDDLQIKIPSLSIQPLVENAIRHGILTKVEGGSITIRAKSYNHYAIVEVIDDGVGMDADTLQKLFTKDKLERSGVGLANVNARLQKLFGEKMIIESSVNKGTKISFRVYMS